MVSHLGPPTFLDVLVPAAVMLLLPYCPILQNHRGPRVALDRDAVVIDQEINRLTDVSGASSEADTADDSDFVPHSDSETLESVASSRLTTPVDRRF